MLKKPEIEAIMADEMEKQFGKKQSPKTKRGINTRVTNKDDFKDLLNQYNLDIGFSKELLIKYKKYPTVNEIIDAWASDWGREYQTHYGIKELYV